MYHLVHVGINIGNELNFSLGLGLTLIEMLLYNN